MKVLSLIAQLANMATIFGNCKMSTNAKVIVRVDQGGSDVILEIRDVTVLDDIIVLEAKEG